MGLEIVHVNAFTNQPFSGNPAAVCLLPESGNDDWMQKVAREMNLSETAFLHREKDGFRLRWFTPMVEVDLCGHATLASAHVVWEKNLAGLDERIRFYTRSGPLSAVRRDDWIDMDFPSEAETAAAAPDRLLEALGVTPSYVGRNRFDYLIEVESEETVRQIAPDFALLREIDARGIIVTSLCANRSYDFVSRFFAPRVGVDEDPVTGSAHCCLAPFWSRRLGKESLVGYQASARGGVVQVAVRGDRVRLSGQAVTVLRGELV